MSKHPIIEIHVTFPNKSEAQNMSNLLIEHHLIACVHILCNIESIYKWKNEIVNENEVLMIGKTRKSLFNKVSEIIQTHHSYKTAQIYSIDISQCNKKYQEWVIAETEVR